jgi:hypothetical protein
MSDSPIFRTIHQQQIHRTVSNLIPVGLSVSSSYAVSASWAPSAQAGIANFDTLTNKPTGLVSSSVQAASWTVATASVALNAPTLPTGLLSASAQVDYTGIQNQPTTIPTASVAFVAVSASYAPQSALPTGLVSSSAQAATWSVASASLAQTASLVQFGNIANQPTLVSSSAQAATWTVATASVALNAPTLPTGLVSASAQIDYTTIQNTPTTIPTASFVQQAVSASFATFAQSALSASWAPSSEGAPTAWNSVTGKPDGIVSSSAQALTWSVQYAQTATDANYAQTAGSASSAAVANVAHTADDAVRAVSSSYAMSASVADFSTISVSSAFAVSSSHADNALFASFAEASTFANTTNFANSANSASYAQIAQTVLGTVASASYFSGTLDFPQGISTPGAITASAFSGSGVQIIGVVSASFATSASWAPNVSGTTSYNALTGIPVGIVSSSAQAASWMVASASVAQTASYVVNAVSASFAPTILPVGVVSSSVQAKAFDNLNGMVSASTQIDYVGITNKPTTIPTASYVVNAVSASYVLSASYAPSVGGGGGATSLNVQRTGSNAGTGITTLNFLGGGLNGITISGVTASIEISAGTVTSASFATTASFAQTAGTASYASGTISFPNGLTTPGTLSGSVVSASAFDLSGGPATLTFDVRVTPPAAPGSGTLSMYARDFASRFFPSFVGPSNIPTPVQSGFFNNSIAFLSTGVTTTIQASGDTVTSIGTVSHPAPNERFGYMWNIATGPGSGSLNISGSTTMTTARVIRGTSVTGSGGWFYTSRIGFPDVQYGAAVGGIEQMRVFAGVTSATMNGVALNPSTSLAHAAGFQFQGPTGDTTWSFVTRDGTNITRQTTGMGMSANSMYDFYVYCAPSGTVIGWRIDNPLTGQSVSGLQSGTLPGASTYLRAGFDTAGTSTTGVRNIRAQRIYLESDR